MQDKTILIADDDTELVHLLSLRFKQLGATVFRSPDAMHALLGAHRVTPDLIVLDVNMPAGNGLSVCEMLATNDALAKIPVVVMTGQSDDQIRERCLLMGAHYLAKGSQLWDRLRSLACELLGEPDAVEQPEVESTPEGTSTVVRRIPRILCIDDDPEISKVLKLRLECYGVDVIRAFSGMQGYWATLDMQPDVIICDLRMPDGEGNYVLGRIKSHLLAADLPVLILSGEKSPAIKRQMLSLGADAYLTKPLVIEDLLQELRRHIPLADTKSPTATPHLTTAPAPQEVETA